MSIFGDILDVALVLPVLCGLLCFLLPSARSVLNVVIIGVLATAAFGLACAWSALACGPVFGAGQWLYLDALSALHMIVLLAVFVLNSVFAHVYFLTDPSGRVMALAEARRFGALWFGALAAMMLVLLSNNLGILWVGVEATTLVTAFLICLHKTPESLEATWKYLIVCSVGVAFAFMGILLIGAAASTANAASASLLHWTHLRDVAVSLDKRLVKLAFVFLLVGYGTKAGLAPMHSWLPDAHSQAPAPVSAMFSGFLLNTALYALMRFIPIVKPVVGVEWVSELLVIFGVLSIVVAAVFILSQNDVKRMLAYCSVEHMGFMALGLGLGPVGVFAALWHMINHSTAKALAFLCAGRLGQFDGSHDFRKLAGASRAHPLFGYGLFAALLALIGLVPFALFWSELFLFQAALAARRYVALALAVLGAAAAFVGILGHALDLAWGKDTRSETGPRTGVMEKIVVFAPLLLLLLLGLWLPGPLVTTLRAAAEVVEGVGP